MCMNSVIEAGLTAEGKQSSKDRRLKILWSS